jgi:carotenoid cleavage dioxygenase-like enzyme
VTYRDPSIIDHLYLDYLRSAKPVTATGNLTRFRIELGSVKDASHEALLQTPIELPRIHYRKCAGLPYRYVYGAGNQVGGDFIDNLVKFDLLENKTASWYEEGCYPGEPVFVASPDFSKEDDGVILSVVLDARKGTSFLLVLEAAECRELARAELPHHVPFGFHGNYFAEAKGLEKYFTLHR